MTASAPPREPRALRVPHAGWRVIAAKELGDHLLSVRFIVLLVVLGLAAAIPLYFAADHHPRGGAPGQRRRRPSSWRCSRSARRTTRSCASTRSSRSSRRCSASPSPSTPSTASASEGTLPRLLAQPIYRDDVINGKFAAGLAVIGIVLLAVDRDHRRLRHLPARDHAGGRGDRPPRGLDPRHVRVRRAVAGVRAAAVGGRPAGGDVGPDRVRRLVPADDLRRADRSTRRQRPSRRSPDRRSRSRSARRRPSSSSPDCCRASSIPRSPRSCSTRRNNPQATLPGRSARRSRPQQQIPTLLAFDQSLLLVMAQVVALVALTVACFACYVAFMRQKFAPRTLPPAGTSRRAFRVPAHAPRGACSAGASPERPACGRRQPSRTTTPMISSP